MDTEEEIIAEFLFNGRPNFYKIVLDDFGEIEKYTKLQNKPNLDQYTSFNSERLERELSKDFANYGMILYNFYRKNQKREKGKKIMKVYVVNRR